MSAHRKCDFEVVSLMRDANAQSAHRLQAKLIERIGKQFDETSADEPLPPPERAIATLETSEKPTA